MTGARLNPSTEVFNVGVQEVGDEPAVGFEELLPRPRLDDLAVPEHGEEVEDPPRRGKVVADDQVAILNPGAQSQRFAFKWLSVDQCLRGWHSRGLVVVGPYNHVRNPMISAVVLVLVGEAILLGSPWVLSWAGALLALNFIYFPCFEEPGLERRFGEPYRAYKRAVPRWIPRRDALRPTRQGRCDQFAASRPAMCAPDSGRATAPFPSARRSAVRLRCRRCRPAR
jgi:Phospholipid methyltransferase